MWQEGPRHLPIPDPASQTYFFYPHSYCMHQVVNCCIELFGSGNAPLLNPTWNVETIWELPINAYATFCIPMYPFKYTYNGLLTLLRTREYSIMTVNQLSQVWTKVHEGDYSHWFLQNSWDFSIRMCMVAMCSIVDQPGMKPACCWWHLPCKLGSAWSSSTCKNTFPTAAGSVMSLYELHCWQSPLPFHSGSIMPLYQSWGTSCFSSMQLNTPTSHSLTTLLPSFNWSIMIEYMPGTLPLLMAFSATCTSPRVTGATVVTAK